MYVDSAVIIIACGLRRAARADGEHADREEDRDERGPEHGAKQPFGPANRDADDDHDRADRRRGQH